MKYKRAISFWTNRGLKKYLRSGLMIWHVSVVKGKIEVIIIEEPNKILYKDNYQIIIKLKEAKAKEKAKLKDFQKNISNYI